MKRGSNYSAAVCLFNAHLAALLTLQRLIHKQWILGEYLLKQQFERSDNLNQHGNCTVSLQKAEFHMDNARCNHKGCAGRSNRSSVRYASRRCRLGTVRARYDADNSEAKFARPSQRVIPLLPNSPIPKSICSLRKTAVLYRRARTS